MKQVIFTDSELQALAQLMDAGVKALGINSVHAASALLTRLEAAEDVPEDTPEE